MKRRQAREFALQLLYQADIRGEPVATLMAVFWEEYPDAEAEIRDYAEQIALGTEAHLAELDRRISAVAINWKLDRMGYIDRNLLRLAAFEILFREDIPPVVAINEAIEIAKRFGKEDSPRFVNGILNKIAEEQGVLMAKRVLSTLAKILVSALFFVLFLSKVSWSTVRGVFATVNVPLVIGAVLIVQCLSFLLAARWFLIVRDELPDEKLSFWLFLRLTMVGLFFNNFLPTGAGGDIAKIFYLVRDEHRKLAIGTSVVIDRFVGALTVMFMALVAVSFAPGIPGQVPGLLAGVFFCLCALVVVVSSRRVSRFLSRGVVRFLPPRLVTSLSNGRVVLAHYFSRRGTLAAAAGLSMVLQIISIGAQYLMVMAMYPGAAVPVSAVRFFIYIPLIWVASIVPSLGGLGVREFSYKMFFSASLGESRALALALLVLLGIFLQSVIGAVIFLFQKVPGGTGAGPGSGPAQP